MLDTEYARLDVKAFDEGARTFSGIATTPTLDRQQDIFEPLGATFANPIVLLLHHDRERPVGTATLGAPTAEGIPFEASIPNVDEPGPLRDRVNEAWQSIKARLIRGVSIGYRPLKGGIDLLKGGRFHLKKTEIIELSLVTIPANVEATITAIKSLDTAAPGLSPDPASRIPLPVVRAGNGKTTMTIAEQITQFETSRAAKDARLTALMTKAAAENVTLDAAESEEYDGLELEIKSIDAHLVRLRNLEKSNAAHAVAVVLESDAAKAAAAAAGRATVPIVQVKSVLPKGTAFTRYVQAIACGRGDMWRAIEYAKQWKDSTPEVELMLKAAVAPGTTTDATWAGPLAPMKPLLNEFLELLRPATILGKISGFRNVPFNVSMPSQTAGGTYSWVGQNAPKPVTKLAFGTVTIGITKCAGIIVITEELARNSTPAAEAVIRADMIAGIAQFLDLELLDPAKAAVAGVSPGSITNGVTPITSAGTTPANARTDIVALMNALTAANIPLAGSTLIMSESNALVLSAALNPLGQPLYPLLSPSGGTGPLGVQVITSQSANGWVVLLSPPCVLYADDGGVTIDVSREASVQMDSAPDNPALATTVFTSLWQNNLVGLRAERFINWKKARTGCVQYTVQTYVG